MRARCVCVEFSLRSTVLRMCVSSFRRVSVGFSSGFLVEEQGIHVFLCEKARVCQIKSSLSLSVPTRNVTFATQ